MTKTYFVANQGEFANFLREKGAEFVYIGTTIAIRLECIDDTAFAILILEFADYLIQSNESINKISLN